MYKGPGGICCTVRGEGEEEEEAFDENSENEFASAFDVEDEDVAFTDEMALAQTEVAAPDCSSSRASLATEKGRRPEKLGVPPCRLSEKDPCFAMLPLFVAVFPC